MSADTPTPREAAWQAVWKLLCELGLEPLAHETAIDASLRFVKELAALRQPVTDAEVAEVLALDEKRSKGVWTTGKMRQPDGHALAWIGNHWVDNLNQRGGCVDKYAEPKDDAAFIAAAPRIASLLRRLVAQDKRMREALSSQTAGILELQAEWPQLAAEDRLEELIGYLFANLPIAQAALKEPSPCS